MNSQKLMIEEAMVSGMKFDDKLEVSKVVLKQSVITRDCMLLYKAGSKADTLQIRYVNNDNTIDQLELKFKSKLTVEKAVMTTNEFNLLDPYKVISTTEIDDIDINTYEMKLDGFYVPVAVILSEFLRSRATTKQLQLLLKDLNVMDEKRITVGKVSLSKSKKINQAIIDLNLYKNTGDKNPVDLTNNNWRRMESVLDMKEDNKQCIEILNKSADAYKLELSEEKEEEDKEICSNNMVEGKIEEETEVDEVSDEKKEIHEKLVKKGVDLLASVHAIFEDSDEGIELSILNLLYDEEKINSFINLKPIRAFLGLEMNDDTKDATTPEDFMLLGEIVTSLSDMLDNINKSTDEEVEQLVKDVISARLVTGLSEEEMKDVNFNEVLSTIEERFKDIMESKTNDKDNAEFELGVSNMVAGKDKDDEDVEEDTFLVGREEDEKESQDDNLNDSIDEVLEKSISEISKHENVEKENKTNNNVNADMYEENNIVYNSMLKECLVEQKGDINKVFAIYGNELNTVKNLFTPSLINSYSKKYDNVAKAMYKHTVYEIKSDLINSLDTVKELLDALAYSVPGYGNIKNMIAKLPIDIKVNMIFALCNVTDKNVAKLTFEEKVKFYATFYKTLDIRPLELVDEKERMNLMQMARYTGAMYRGGKGDKVINL